MNDAANIGRCITWPEGKRFAFTVFDDTDGMTMLNGPPIYDFLADLGFRTTKSVWPIQVKGASPQMVGATCQDPAYVRWVRRLQEQGFEIGLHGVTNTTVGRGDWETGLRVFRGLFGDYPATHANHADCLDSIYWGDQRVSGLCRFAYNVMTGFGNRQFRGHCPDSPNFWGDLCADHIKYVRNFVYPDINTLKECPQMPYHDPDRPFVKYWFASSEGPSVQTFNETLSEANQEKLEAEGGACIMYTHFANGFLQSGRVEPRFSVLMRRLSMRPGWFVPVSQLLDYLEIARGSEQVITAAERRKLERKWLAHKIRVRGTT